MGKLRGPIWNIKHSDGPDQKNNYSVRCLLSNTSYSSFISLSLSYLPLFYIFFLHTLQIFLVFHNQAKEIRHIQLPHLFKEIRGRNLIVWRTEHFTFPSVDGGERLCPGSGTPVSTLSHTQGDSSGHITSPSLGHE